MAAAMRFLDEIDLPGPRRFADSFTARFSTWVIPEGTQNDDPRAGPGSVRLCTLWMK